jgi:hypothetical protein
VLSKQYFPALHAFTVGDVSGEQTDPEGHCYVHLFLVLFVTVASEFSVKPLKHLKSFPS